jgi:preprotein translocase subunit Sec61beta
MTSSPGSDPPPPRQARLGEVVSAVLWSFFGVRKGAKMKEDAVSIRPHQVIIVGVAIAALLVLILLLVARLVVRAAGA